MFRKSFFVAVLVLALVTMACGININLPIRDIKTGPTQTDPINIPAPGSGVANVTLNFGAGELRLAPGAEDALVTGTATYNVADLKPEIITDDNNIRIETGDLEIRGIPNFQRDVRNEWDLQFGETTMDLRINAGAYQGRFELGGLSIRSLVVGDGAADVELDFSEPNQVEMDALRYETGASNVELSGLANANFGSMVFRSGAGDYTLDFSGELQRDASVDIQSGISQVRIIVPEGTSARVNFTGGLSNVNSQDAWQQNGNDYTLSGSGPTLTINVDMGAGNLELRNR